MPSEPHYQMSQGAPIPLGCSKRDQAVNFALFSQHATSVALCLFLPGEEHPFLKVAFDPKMNRTGWVWHIAVAGLPPQVEYGYLVNGPTNDKTDHFNPTLLLLDPYARAMASSQKWGAATPTTVPRGRVVLETAFDWEKDTLLHLPMEELVIYEMHVRAFTEHASSQAAHRGGFLGVIEKIPHLKKLGVNAVELMPVHEFNECENERVNPVTGKQLYNFWGYSTQNFFSPMNRYASSPGWDTALVEFKTMVKELHKNGIEVILDVVYNHTAEGGQTGPTLSFKGIDNDVYYMVDREGRYLDFTGCGNTCNANHPTVMQLIIDSLRYWVVEMHVDGFRFDLASALTRAADGLPLSLPPLIEAISKDPILGSVKLIAEPWDAKGLYQVGSFPTAKWSEWNGWYRDTVRRFIKGSDGEAGHFATALSGSEHLYWGERFPYHSINFVTAHDGYSLRDLVSYERKHNESNGEQNRDGSNDNSSWNCGHEGATSDPTIASLRERQMKNFHLALMVSIGTPMLLMGDEYGHTRQGNNNPWCQDNELNWFLWNECEKNEEFFRFYSFMIHFRKEHSLLKRKTFLAREDVDWHGKVPMHPDWGWQSRFLAYTLKDHEKSEHLYIAFNASHEAASVQLPDPPQGKQWILVVDTAKPLDPENKTSLERNYEMVAHSALIAKASN